MKTMRAISITALAFAAHFLLLPSCVQWQMGKSIRECAETRVGINPMDVWYVGEKRPTKVQSFYADGRPTEETARAGRVEVAREVRYEADSALVQFNGLFPTYPSAQHIEMTKHFREVSFRYSKIGGMEPHIGQRVLTEGQKMERADLGGMEGWHYELNAHSLGSAEVERSKWYPLAVVAAAPFDYLIDPALSVACTPIGVLYGAGSIVYSELTRWWHRTQREEEPLTTPEP